MTPDSHASTPDIRPGDFVFDTKAGDRGEVLQCSPYTPLDVEVRHDNGGTAWVHVDDLKMYYRSDEEALSADPFARTRIRTGDRVRCPHEGLVGTVLDDCGDSDMCAVSWDGSIGLRHLAAKAHLIRLLDEGIRLPPEAAAPAKPAPTPARQDADMPDAPLCSLLEMWRQARRREAAAIDDRLGVEAELARRGYFSAHLGGSRRLG